MGKIKNVRGLGSRRHELVIGDEDVSLRSVDEGGNNSNVPCLSKNVM